MNFFLSPDVYACSSGHLLVFLDLSKDRYFAAPRSALELDAGQRTIGAHSDEGLRWGAKLLEKELVTDRIRAAPPTLGAGGRVLPLPPPVAFIAALTWAMPAVDRPGGLCSALREIAARRREAPLDHEKARIESERFQAWRPLWPRPYVCLYDTMALAWFLSARGASCEVKFGVQAEPFAAHCWAESGRQVLNDDSEYCASFDVILRT